MTIFLYFGRCFPKVFFKSTTEDAETGKTGKFTDLGYCILAGLQKFECMVHAYRFDKVGWRLICQCFDSFV